jgi:AraC-like DNA-binding protein
VSHRDNEPRHPVELARRYIDAHFTSSATHGPLVEQPLNLDALAQQVHLSRFHLLRAFRQVYGETPHAYLTRLRMTRAKELLTATDLSVTDVCLHVGYESLGSFSASFRRYVGHSPYNYRARVFQSVQIAQVAARYVPYCFIFMRAQIRQDSNFREAKPGRMG